MKIRQSVFVPVLVAAAAVLAPLYGPAVRAQAPPASQTGDDLESIQRSVMGAYALVEKNFADKVDSEKAFYGTGTGAGAIPGMLRTLDPHSNFVDPQEYAEMQRKMHAEYFGVGMEIFLDTASGHVIVTRPFAGSPAWKADLRRGDIITAVDGKDTKGMDTSAVAGMLRGPRGTNVRVTVKREGAPDYISVEVTRGSIETTLVDAFWVQPGIVYLKIDSFEAQNVSRDVEANMRRLGEGDVKGMILDLRENPGGLVSEAVNVAGRFLKDGVIVVSHHGRAEAEQMFRAKAVAAAQKYPMVVLVNEHSASAAEIVSGALQDHDRAWILGTTTFGKGLVQAQFPLHEGAALLLTIAHYYTPSGRLIQRDYSHSSFYDYYTHHDGETQNTQDIKATDSGRKVFGGGGITPDEKYPSHVYNLFERRTLGNLAFMHFGGTYWAGGAKPSLPANWQPDTTTVERFRTYLKTTSIPFTDEEFNANLDFIRQEIRYELYWRAFDKTTAERARWADDPEVKKGVESLPKAQSLLQTVQRVLAERGIHG